MKLFQTAVLLLCASVSLVGCDGKKAEGAAGAKPKIRVGYIVKALTDEWFSNEIKFAKQAGEKDGFEVVQMGAKDGSELMADLDTLSAKGCKATVLCTPDVKLGPAIVAACKEKGLKLITVDDQLVDAEGKPLAEVPYVGISAFDIGKNVGAALHAEAQKRGWKMEETGVVALNYEPLPTAMKRTAGCADGLKAAGFPQANIFFVSLPEPSIASSFNTAEAILQKHAECKHWLVCGPNDECVLGSVRRVEKDFKPADIIGIGINGDKAAVDEFKKPELTGFFGTIQLEARKHGEDTARAAYLWVKDGKAPAAETLTVGKLMTRANYEAVRKEQGLE